MPYIGRTPANAAITSDDINNGIVTADKLATNAVTEVKVNADAITNAKTEFTPGLTIKGDGSSADGKLSKEEDVFINKIAKNFFIYFFLF